MPTTRRKRANSPEQPENAQAAAEQRAQESNPEAPNASAGGTVSSTEHPEQSATTETKEASAQEPATTVPSEQEAPHRATKSEEHPQNALAPANYQHPALFPPVYPQQNTFSNGERQTREYHPHVEGGRRAPFRRQPQNITPPAPVPTTPPAASANLQPPSHEIKLPLGNKLGDTTGDTLHLAYNPGYTKADEVRAELLKRLVEESKTGGRARCWNCGSLAIVYDSWNTKNKTFGEIGIAYCEICGVWSVM